MCIRVTTSPQLTALQQVFADHLLTQATFQKHLCAVREINAMLARSEASASPSTAAGIAQWLRQSHVVPRLLKSNLHQKQYVDQVGLGVGQQAS